MTGTVRPAPPALPGLHGRVPPAAAITARVTPAEGSRKSAYGPNSQRTTSRSWALAMDRLPRSHASMMAGHRSRSWSWSGKSIFFLSMRYRLDACRTIPRRAGAPRPRQSLPDGRTFPAAPGMRGSRPAAWSRHGTVPRRPHPAGPHSARTHVFQEAPRRPSPSPGPPKAPPPLPGHCRAPCPSLPCRQRAQRWPGVCPERHELLSLPAAGAMVMRREARSQRPPPLPAALPDPANTVPAIHALTGRQRQAIGGRNERS